MIVHTLASGVGAVAGAAAVLVGMFFPVEVFRGVCLSSVDVCSLGTGGYGGYLVAFLGVVLLVASVVAYFGPRVGYYAQAAASALVVIIILTAEGGRGSAYAWAVLVPSMTSTVLGLMAARSRGGMAEQGNPMNLPVFG